MYQHIDSKEEDSVTQDVTKYPLNLKFTIFIGNN